MSETKHSPLPWRRKQTSRHGAHIVDNEGQFITSVNCENSGIDQDEADLLDALDRHNADFIVNAGNAHAELVAALEEAREFIAADGYRATSELLTTIDITLQKAKQQ